MATKKKDVVPPPPVSMDANIEINVFSEPQNGMLGFVVASDEVNGKFVRYAHAYLMDDGPNMSLDTKIGRKKVTFEDLDRLHGILTLFEEKVQAFYANR